jgi:HEAT repeat protein
MAFQSNNDSDIGSLIVQLSDKDGMIRDRARKKLVKTGKSAVTSLLDALKNSKIDQVRWEAAKALGAIADKRSIVPFVDALEDEFEDVTWLAAEALKKAGMDAWPALLEALKVKGSKSKLLRDGAHHILKGQRKSGYNELLEKLVRSLEIEGTLEAIEPAADEILKKMGKMG